MRFISQFCLMLLAVATSFVMAQPVSTKDWENREAMVDPAKIGEPEIAAWQGGQWEEKSTKGSYRFVLTESIDQRNKLYIQWLDGKGELISSVSVMELNSRPEYRLIMPECVSEDCSSAIVHAEHTVELSKRSFTLDFGGVGRYSFKL